jgi:hypothetical protein
MDARYCALSRISFGLNTGGAGAGPGDNLRAPPAQGLSGATGLDATISGPCGSPPRPRGSTLAPVAQLFLHSPPWLNSSPLWLNSLSPGWRHHLRHLRLLSSPPWLNSRPRGSTLRRRGSTLAPVAQLFLPSPPWLNSSPLWLNSLSPGWRRAVSPLAIGHGRIVGLLAGVSDRRTVSPLSSSSACSGAGSGWHGCGRFADAP